MTLIRRGGRWVEVTHRHDFVPRAAYGLNPDGSARVWTCSCGERRSFAGTHDLVIVRR